MNVHFDRVLGQPYAKEILAAIIQNQRLSKAYIFSGPEGVGKDALAIEFAKAINCLQPEGEVPCQTCANCRQFGALSHPDFRVVYPASAKDLEKEGTQRLQKKAKDPYFPLAKDAVAKILIDNMRDVKQFVSLKIHSARHRVILISEADRMNEAASNSILKLLEEPPPQTILILTTSRINQLLPTIVSRCQVVSFGPLQAQDIEEELKRRGVKEDQARVVSRLAEGSFRKAMVLLQEDYNSLRNLAYRALQLAAGNEVVEQLDFVETLSSGRNRSLVKDFLSLALLFLRDVYFLHQLQFENPNWEAVLTNFDRREELEKLAMLLEDKNVAEAITKTEKLIDLVDKNIYINLILIDFMNLFRSVPAEFPVDY